MVKGGSAGLISMPRAAIVTDKNNLTIPLALELLKSECRVTIISENPSYWKKRFKEINHLEFLEILKSDFRRIDSKYNYIVFINLHQEKKEKKTIGRLKLSIKLIKENYAKALFVYPYAQTLKSRKRINHSITKINKDLDYNFGVLFIGQPVGVGMDISVDGHLTKILREFLYERKVGLPNKIQKIYPVNDKKLAREVVKSLFSFGAFGNKTVIASPPITSVAFARLLKKINPDLVRENTNIDMGILTSSVERKILLEQNTGKEIENILSKLSKEKLMSTQVKAKKRKRVMNKIRGIKPGKNAVLKNRGLSLSKGTLIKVSFFLTFLIALPFLLIMASASGLIFAKEQALKGNLDISKKAFTYTRAASLATKATFETFSKFPVMDTLLKPFLPASSFLVRAANLGSIGIAIIENASFLVGKMTGSEVYALNNYVGELVLNLDDFYKKAGFLQGELGLMSGTGGYLVKSIVSEQNLKNTRDRAYYSKEAVSELAGLIGGDRQKTYLVIIQDNLELRPTGGLINAFAIVTFNSSRIIDVTTQSVYEADQFLTGFVEPPGPIKKYLGRVNWSLRESNWDADFPTTAERAEWFLDKEIDKQVDGVIAFDLEFIRQFLSLSAPIKINSIKQEINSQNLIDLVTNMYSSPNEPKQKADFFSELLRESLLRMTNLSEKERPKVISLFIESLDNKHVQMFLHNRIAQRAISELNWDGSIWDFECSQNCSSDWVSIVESNFSENASSLEFKKNAELSVVFEEGVVKKKLELILSYIPKDVQKKDKYKTYIRVLTQGLSGFTPAIITDELGTRKLETDIEEVRGHKEAGVYVEFESGSKKSVVFSWEGPSELVFSKPGEYNFSWRKQAGTFSDPIVLMIYFPEEISYTSNIQPFLTEAAVLGYNTKLSRDFVSRISW